MYPDSLQGLVCLQMEAVHCLGLCQAPFQQWIQRVEQKVDWIGLDLKLKDYFSSKIYITQRELF